MKTFALFAKHSRTDPALTNPLNNIHIASPCPASWEKMAGDERIRHCHECKLSVYNLSEMTRIEAERLIANREGRLCVRFYRRADGTILTRDCPKGLRAVTERVSRIAGAVLSTMMTVAPAFGQSATAPNTPTQSASKEAQLGMDVSVVDPANAVIQNAKVTLCRCKNKVTINSDTDSNGVAHFRGLPRGSYEVIVHAPGFRKSHANIKIKRIEQLQVKLQIAVQTTTVEVRAEPVEMMGTVGMVTVTEGGFPPMPMSTGRPAPLR